MTNLFKPDFRYNFCCEKRLNTLLESVISRLASIAANTKLMNHLPNAENFCLKSSRGQSEIHETGATGITLTSKEDL